ncbi:MAG TPA: M56 family metallopeptidase, partial [Cyclobacteriaceae bacterium]
MKEMINYIIEANVALLLFLTIYWLFLRKETNFRFLRFFMLIAIFVSALLPFIHLNRSEDAAILTIKQVIPEYWLPEIVIGGEAGKPQQAYTNAAYDIWQFAGWVYITGMVIFFLWLTMQLGYILIMLRNASVYTIDAFKIIETSEDKPSFSFFNLIYIGRSHELTSAEKEQIIRHEQVHAHELHSLDILIVTILGIVFWFNPFIRTYKKIFIQLHEFEADARAVESSDVNMYCSLLARVALQSHFPIASHFNESLTVKRIEMMRTIKRKIENWKLVAVTASIAFCFVVIACQDQIIEEVSNSTIAQTSDYPDDVKTHMNAYLKDHPNAKLTYMEGEAKEMDRFTSTEQVSSRVIYNYAYKKNQGLEKKGVLLTDVVEEAETLTTDDKVFLVVEKAPEYPGGFDALKGFISKNLKYPTEDASKGVTGTVFVSFVIIETGAVTDVTLIKGVSATIDAEALRIVKMFPNWTPGEQNGTKVKTRYVVPIRFGQPTSRETVEEVEIPNKYRMKVDY